MQPPVHPSPRPTPLWAQIGGRFLGSMSSRDYRWLWLNNAVNSLGMTMEMLAQGWLVLTLTDSAAWVGGVAGIRGLGSTTFSIVGGTLADRLDRRKALILFQALRAIIVGAVAALLLTDNLQIGHVVVMVFFLGVCMGLNVPINNALVYDVVGPDRILNAIAARNIAFNVSRIVGGFAFYALVNTVDMGGTYAVVTGAFVVSIVPLVFVHSPKPLAPVKREPILQNLVGGLSYAVRHRSIRVLLALSVLVEAFGFSHQVLLPVVARDVLGGGERELGWLSSAAGVGAMIGTLIIASLGNFRAKGLLLTVTTLGTGLALIGFAFSPWLAVSMVLVAGLNTMIWAYDSTLGAVLQLIALEEMRGRVLGLYSLTWGFTSLGGFGLGLVAAAVGAPIALGAGAVLLMGYTLVSAKTMLALDRPPAEEAPARAAVA